jgi:cyclopropane fatty-acyl-phospholipid synthase-like methyltransferase
MESKEWFESWFDTSYYHSLYKNRNDIEAASFVTNLVQFLDLKKESKVLDLACGKGRHSLTLNKLGLNVLGVDLSQNSIEFAKKSETKNLKFLTHDMREVIPNQSFHVIFNLFTSFGYFDDFSDNEKVITAIHEMLEDKGIFVIDFMNSEKTIANLVLSENKIEDNINFNITRKYDGQHIFKKIKFNDKNTEFCYTERVQALKLNDFEDLLLKHNFQMNHTFGDFELNPFDSQNSDRLIIIATKI